MDGWNIGRKNRGAGRCANRHRLEMRDLSSHDHFKPGTSGVISWNRGGEPTAEVNFSAYEHSVELRYKANGESVTQRIAYVFTRTNFTGRRRRFACPRCGRTCDVLYGGIRFYCRICWRLTYGSQYSSWRERARSKSEKIRTKLGQPGFIAVNDPEGFPDKPKWMRWRTYDRLQAEDERLMDVYEDGVNRMILGFLRRHGKGGDPMIAAE